MMGNLMDIHKELGLDDATPTIDRIWTLRQSEVNLQVLREQQNMLAAQRNGEENEGADEVCSIGVRGSRAAGGEFCPSIDGRPGGAQLSG